MKEEIRKLQERKKKLLEAIEFTKKICQIKENITIQTSALLAKEKGCFLAYDKEKFTNTISIISILIKYKADPNLEYDKGKTPLILARELKEAFDEHRRQPKISILVPIFEPNITNLINLLEPHELQPSLAFTNKYWLNKANKYK
jgi:ribonucleotide reductase alpha subunit